MSRIHETEQAVRAAHVAAGGQIVQLTPEQREAWRKAVAPLMPKWVEDIGPGGAKFFEQIESARKACEKRG